MGSGAVEQLSELVHSGIEQAVDALGRAASDGLDAGELTDLLRVAFTEQNRLDAAVTGAIGALDRSAERAGREPTMALPTASWLSHTLQLSSSSAHARVQLARHLPGLPDTAAAFRRGELSGHHASVIARAVEHVLHGGGQASDAEVLMLQEARHRDPRDLLRYGLGLLHRMAPREMEAEEERRHRQRFLHLSEVLDGGSRLDGFLDSVEAATLRTALDAVLGPRAKDDRRTPGQRRADGLAEIAGRCLEAGDLPERGGQRPHLTVTASLETLRADPGAPAALLDWGFPISGRALRRIAGDAELTPILLSRGGDPLHVGRRYRTATRKMRRALAERDRHCVWPGCERTPDWCQNDHIVPWAQGGRTEVEGMRILCDKHHRLLNEGWRLERLPDGRMVAHAPPPGHRPPARHSGSHAGPKPIAAPQTAAAPLPPGPEPAHQPDRDPHRAPPPPEPEQRREHGLADDRRPARAARPLHAPGAVTGRGGRPPRAIRAGPAP